MKILAFVIRCSSASNGKAMINNTVPAPGIGLFRSEVVRSD